MGGRQRDLCNYYPRKPTRSSVDLEEEGPGQKSKGQPVKERGWSEFIQSRNKLSEVSLLSQTRVGEV